MTIIPDKENGLFPHSHEISFDCSCPDWASMCKHVAAVLYGVGARLDTKPEELFKARQVDHLDLIGSAASMSSVISAKKGSNRIKETELSSLFDMDIEEKQGENIKVKPAEESQKVQKKTMESLS